MDQKFLETAFDRFLKNLKWCIENEYEITADEIAKIRKQVREKGISAASFSEMSSEHPLFLGFDEFEMDAMLDEYKQKTYRMEI